MMNAFRFAHMSDCHLGAWGSHPELRELPLRAFKEAIDMAVNSGVDFVLIAGDLFDTSLPGIDIIKFAAKTLRRCRDSGIPVYVVAGSHDYSPSGKSMLSVLEEAGLLISVARGKEENGLLTLAFTEDKKTGAKIVGMPGRKGGLDRTYYEALNREALENEKGFKIFMLHAAIEEFKPAFLKNVMALPSSLLPKKFDYYANGHVHEKFVSEKMVFPGELFPTSFDELEKYNSGFFFVRADGRKTELQWMDLKLCDVLVIKIDANGKPPNDITQEILKELAKRDLTKKIVLLRIEGTLESGRVSEIDFRTIHEKAMENGAIAVKKNVSKLMTREFEEVKITPNIRIEELEADLIKEHIGKIKVFLDETEATNELMKILDDEKNEGETNISFEERILSGAKKVFGLSE